MSKKTKEIKESTADKGQFWGHIVRILEHLLLCVLAFEGVMSLVQADPLVKWSTAVIVVFLLAKDTL